MTTTTYSLSIEPAEGDTYEVRFSKWLNSDIVAVSAIAELKFKELNNTRGLSAKTIAVIQRDAKGKRSVASVYDGRWDNEYWDDAKEVA